MRPFIYQGKLPAGSIQVSEIRQFARPTPDFIELFTPWNALIGKSKLPDNAYSVIYWIQLDESWVVVTWWEELLDPIFTLLDNGNTAKGTLKALRKSWPTFQEIYTLGTYDNSQIAFSKGIDPETNRHGTFLGCEFAGGPVDDFTDLLTGQGAAAFSAVFSSSLKLSRETLDGPAAIPDLTKFVGRSMRTKALIKAIPELLDDFAAIIGGN